MMKILNLKLVILREYQNNGEECNVLRKRIRKKKSKRV